MVRGARFGTFVLVSYGVAVGCGGVVQRSAGDGAGASGSANGGAAGADETGGTTAVGTGATGGESFGGFTGATGGAGSGGVFPFGGGGAPPNTDAGPLPCVPAQWECNVDLFSCNSVQDAYVVSSGSAGCHCDPGRPLSADDCKPAEVYVCAAGSFSSDGVVVEVPFQCRCVTATPDCGVCSEEFGQDLDCTVDASTGSSSISCGCSVIHPL